jgi:hypothetical protein
MSDGTQAEKRAPFLEEAKKMILEHAEHTIESIADSLVANENNRAAGSDTEVFREALENSLREHFDEMCVGVNPDTIYQIAISEHYLRPPEDTAKLRDGYAKAMGAASERKNPWEEVSVDAE